MFCRALDYDDSACFLGLVVAPAHVSTSETKVVGDFYNRRLVHIDCKPAMQFGWIPIWFALPDHLGAHQRLP
eukprot:498280-Amphidinium_carterae.1